MKKRRMSAFNAKKKALFNEKKAQFKAKKAKFRKSKLSVSLAWANILTQALFPMGVAFTPAVMAETSDKRRAAAPTASKGEQQTATAATRLAGVLSSDDAAQSAESMARGIATSKGNQAVEEWLNQFGSSKVQLNLDDKMNLKGSQVDALFALEDTPSALLFSQMGVRVHEDDNDLTVNLGLGKRHFFEHQTFGYNVFLDRDIDGQHTRGGLGAEYMRDNLRLSTNSYLSLGGWKNSHHLDGYDEKAANGFDVRAEGYLPSMPQLGGKLMYEKYFGDNVGLFGKDKLQKDPSAFTVGLNYTPIPLITMGVDRKQGNSGTGDTHFNLSFNYAFGTPFSKQISASNVAAKRSLEGSRYDLVDRNNEIVLKYQEQAALRLSMPATLQGSAGQTLALQVQVESRNGIDRFEWDDTLLTAAKGKIVGSDGNWQVVLPSYSFGGNNSYPVSLVVYDKAGNKSQVAQTMVTVTGYGINGQYSTLQSSKTTMVADKISTATIELVLNDANQQPITGIADNIQFVTEQSSVPTPVAAASSKQFQQTQQPHTVSNITELKEKPGTYQATLTSGSEPGMVVITAKIDDSVLANISSKIMLTSIMDTANIESNSLKISNDGDTIADGKTTNTAELLVKDINNNPLPGYDVTFVVVNPDGNKTTVAVPTDENGVAKLPVTSVKAGKANISATVSGTTVSAEMNFVADAATATIADGGFVVVNDGAVANSVATNSVRVTVTDALGNVVPNQIVTFAASNGAVITDSVSTDDQGVATVTLTSPKAGISQVTATVNGNAFNLNVNFVADSATATIAEGAFVVVNDGAAANGTDTNSVRVTVTDAQGNPVPDQSVTFAADNGATITDSVSTDDQGIATVTLTNPKAGISRVTATVNGQSFTINVNFVADAATAAIADGAFVVVNDGAVANGNATNSVQVTVTDAQGNLVPNQVVAFMADNGATVTSNASTNDQGQVTVTLTSPKAGSSQVTATVNGKSSNISVNFIADAATATIADGAFVIVDDGAAANGVATNSVRVTITDAQGNLVPNQSVNFAANNGAVIAGSALTNEQGIATVTLTNLKSGGSQVTATVNGKPFNKVVSFVADSATATIKDDAFVVVNNGAVANGTATNSVKVTVTDAQGNLVPNQTVTFRADNDANIASSAVTNDQGIASVTLMSTKAGTSQVTATVGSNEKTVATNFIADASTAEISADNFTVEVDGQISGVGKNKVQVLVTDKYGNPVPNMAVTFAATNSVTSNASATKTDSAGKITADLSLANAVGTVSTITATMTNTASVKSVQTATVTFYPDFTKATLNTPTNAYSGFSISSGFPTTAFKTANFQLSPHGVAATNTNYDWQSSDANVTVSSAGLVTFVDNPTGEVTITATWKQDSSKVFTYKFNVGLWVVSSTTTAVSQAAAITACQSLGGRLPTATEVANGVGVRGLGSLFGEWGNLAAYSGITTGGIIWTAETGQDFHPADGTVHAGGNSVAAYICVK